MLLEHSGGSGSGSNNNNYKNDDNYKNDNKDNITKQIIRQDYPEIAASIRRFIADRLEKSNTSGVILGLSGGVDSAVLAYICADGGESYNHGLKGRTLALVMPDTTVTPDSETQDAIKMISLTGIDYKLVDIAPIVKEYSMYLEPDERARGNLRARVRADIMYYYANLKDCLVLGSSDKSEYLTGYFTKFGDGAADLLPIVTLYKLQVRQLARQLGVPDWVIAKKSSPYLWSDHGAEDELGATYEQIDPILYCMFEEKHTVSETARLVGADEHVVEKIRELYINSRHKRQLPEKEGSMS